MTVQPTSRRALLKGAAMLTAIPVAALGGVPVFDVVEDPLPLHPFAQRIATACQWFDLALPTLTYDPEDLVGGPLITEDLAEWMRETGRPMMRWLVQGEPVGYTREQALADPAEWPDQQRFLRSISHLDETELRLLLDGIERGQSGEVPFEVAMGECKRALQAHRASRTMGAAA